jgi:hypothetical protein
MQPDMKRKPSDGVVTKANEDNEDLVDSSFPRCLLVLS